MIKLDTFKPAITFKSNPPANNQNLPKSDLEKNPPKDTVTISNNSEKVQSDNKQLKAALSLGLIAIGAGVTIWALSKGKKAKGKGKNISQTPQKPTPQTPPNQKKQGRETCKQIYNDFRDAWLLDDDLLTPHNRGLLNNSDLDALSPFSDSTATDLLTPHSTDFLDSFTDGFDCFDDIF